MKGKITVIILAGLSIVSCKILKPSADKFIAYGQHFGMRLNLLAAKVHATHLNISYRYGSDCPANKTSNAKELEEATTTALQAWLQPLRKLHTAKPIVSQFRYTEKAKLLSSDLRITFQCSIMRSSTLLHTVDPPDIILNRDVVVGNDFMSSLVHEVGHAFGLTDTYVGRHGDSTGGVNSTAGTQPPSLMSHRFSNFSNKSGTNYLSEDDKRGIIWLYKVFHEGLKIDDCFFPDYVFERDPDGCRPKYPLIFEVKHGDPEFALLLFRQDPKIDINEQDAGGLTALHYASIYGQRKVVKKLLTHKHIKPGLKDKQGRTALDVAREASLTEIIALLQAVTPQQRAEDINGDGMVNILDLVAVANNFGKKGKNIADVNGDSMVDIRDLVRVASAFGSDVASAPFHPEVTKLVTNTQVNRWLIAARQQASTKPAHRRGIQVLEQLLARATPPQTRLLANYPNPFNPETWLPYQLAKPMRAKIIIHAADGKLVRTLELGNLPAGVYQSKSRAAHWDGRNAQGELVASGIYFYTLSAGGDVTTTRKMILRK